MTFGLSKVESSYFLHLPSSWWILTMYWDICSVVFESCGALISCFVLNLVLAMIYWWLPVLFLTDMCSGYYELLRRKCRHIVASQTDNVFLLIVLFSSLSNVLFNLPFFPTVPSLAISCISRSDWSHRETAQHQDEYVFRVNSQFSSVLGRISCVISSIPLSLSWLCTILFSFMCTKAFLRRQGGTHFRVNRASVRCGK